MNEIYEKYISNSIEWAKLHLNSTKYTYMCLGFVEDSLERSNNIEIFGGNSAKESADLYEAYKNTGIPPEGAFVFYDCSGPINGNHSNWGHVGLSISGGAIIHAWDRVKIDNYMEVEKLTPSPGWQSPKYIGWVPLERILIGYQSKVY